MEKEIARLLADAVSENVTDRVMKEVEYLLRVSDEKEEERFKQLDETGKLERLAAVKQRNAQR